MMCLHALVTGCVQGVFYRDSTCNVATELGLSGWVRNLADGRVELKAYGDMEKLTKLEAWLHEGPPAAKVDAVSADYQESSELCEGFSVRY